MQLYEAHFKSLVEGHSVTVFVDVHQHTIAFYHEAISMRLSNAAGLGINYQICTCATFV